MDEHKDANDAAARRDAADTAERMAEYNADNGGRDAAAPSNLDDLTEVAQAKGLCQVCGKRPPQSDDYACSSCARKLAED